MAGIGGYPQVINLPRDTRWESLGEGLGKFAGNIFDAWNTADTMQKAQQIPDLEHQMIYVQSRLGEKGDKYIDTRLKLMQSKENALKFSAEIEHWKQQDKYRETQDQINQIILQNKQRELDATIAEKEHRANAVRARAGGSSAKADQQEASADKQKAEADKIRLEIQQRQEGARRLQEYLQSQGKGPASSVPPTATPPIPRPQSYEQPYQPPKGAEVRQISSGDVIVPPAPTGGGTINIAGPVATMPETAFALKPGEAPKDPSLDQLESLRKFSTSGTQLLVPVPGITQETINQAMAETEQGKEGEAWKAIKAAKQPKDVRMENIGGGFQALTGLYEDGQRYIVPGSRVEDKRKPMDAQEQRAEQNVGLWQASNRVMRELSDQPDQPVGHGFFSQLAQSAAGRAVDAWLYRNTGQTLSPNTPRYLAQYALARTSLDSMMAGLRETDTYRRLLDTTQPGYSDSPSVKRAKFDTMEMAADLMIKARIEDARTNGRQYGAGMAALYKAHGLEGMSVDDITEKYMRAGPTKKEPAAPSTAPRSGSKLRPLGDTGVSIEVE